MELKVKRITASAKLPERATKNDAGFDIFADQNAIIGSNTMVVKTGIAIEIPEGFYGRLKGRSGLTSKTNLRVQEGTIDSGYRGELGIICDVKSRVETKGDIYTYVEIKKGEKIAQLIIQPLPKFEVVEVNELSDSQRGTGGFGSTGK